MSTPLQVQPNKVSGGLCPHGLPPSACPICSGGGAGGAKKADFSAKAGEMSWNQCAAIGAMLRAQKLNAQMNEQAYQNRLQAVARFEIQMANMAQKIASLAVQISSLPSFFSKPANILFNNILIPFVNTMKNMPANIMKFADKVFEKFHDIQDKLNAMFGELKNAIEKKISDKLRDYKKKVASLFELFDPREVEEEKEVDAAKGKFEVKTFLHEVYNKITGTLQSYDKLKQEEQEDDKTD